MNFQDRVNFYIGKTSNETIKNSHLPYSENNGNKYFICNKSELISKSLKDRDIEPFQSLVNKCQITNKNLYLLVGDIHFDYQIKIFAKTRPSGTYNHILLKCFEKNRHWKDCLYKDELKFEQKINKLIWRGATTGGYFDENGILQTLREANRFSLVEKYYQDMSVDIGFGEILPQFYDSYMRLLKNKMSLQEMCEYKYILSVEGNDKDSGLNWKLRSKSLVVMPKPTITSWLMEETLIPNIHYIEIKNDFSDLIEKIDWCNDNPSVCKNIVYNANLYMEQFENKNIEEKLEEIVIKNYLK